MPPRLRNLKSLWFEPLRAALRKLAVSNAIIDAEIICLYEKAISQFDWSLNGRRADRAMLYAFDLLWLDGNDLRRLR